MPASRIARFDFILRAQAGASFFRRTVELNLSSSLPSSLLFLPFSPLILTLPLLPLDSYFPLFSCLFSFYFVAVYLRLRKSIFLFPLFLSLIVILEKFPLLSNPLPFLPSSTCLRKKFFNPIPSPVW